MKPTILLLAALSLTFTACQHKAYYLNLGEGGSAHLAGGWMGSNVLEGTLSGPIEVCSIPEDFKGQAPCEQEPKPEIQP